MLDVEEIYDEHLERVYAFFAYRLGSRDDAEDLTQATFERAVRSAKRYDTRRASPITWLLTIAQNLLIDHYRRSARHDNQPLDPDDADRVLPAVQPLEAGALELDPELAAALSLLGEREREIVALRYGADLSGPQIAELTGLTLGNVQQILSRSLRRMRADIEKSRRRGTRGFAAPPTLRARCEGANVVDAQRSEGDQHRAAREVRERPHAQRADALTREEPAA